MNPKIEFSVSAYNNSAKSLLNAEKYQMSSKINNKILQSQTLYLKRPTHYEWWTPELNLNAKFLWYEFTGNRRNLSKPFLIWAHFQPFWSLKEDALMMLSLFDANKVLRSDEWKNVARLRSGTILNNSIEFDISKLKSAVFQYSLV